MNARRPYLAVFRAGTGTVHRRMLDEDPGRNWDCFVDWWCDPAGIPLPQLEERAFRGGENKFDGFAAFYEREWSDVWGYRYVLLADDDVYFRPGDLSRLFSLCEAHRLHLCQPALRWGTHISHLVTLWNPASRVRHVSFVEVMTPCFSSVALRELVPTFRDSRSTYGIDWAWAALLRGRDAIHVVDAVRVDHVRPVDWSGGALYRKLQALRVDPAAEMRAAKARHGEFGGVSTCRRGHCAASPLGPALGDASVVATGWLVVQARRSLDLLRRLWARLRRRHIPAFPGDKDPRSSR